MQTQRGGESIAPTHLQRRCKKMGGQHHAPTALSRERPGSHCTGGWISSVGLKQTCDENVSSNYVQI